MKKTSWYCQIIFTINSISFVILNINSNIVTFSGFYVLWVWTIWLYMVLNIFFLANSFVRASNVTLSCLINYLLQMILVWCYVFGFCSNAFELPKKILAIILILLMIVILILNSQEMKRDNHVHVIRKSFSNQDIEKYIKSILLFTKKEKEDIYIGVVMCNILSFLMIILLPLIIDVIQNIIGEKGVTTFILMVLLIIFIVISYFKYKTMNIHLFAFFIEIILSIMGICLYLKTLDTIIQGIPIIIICIYFLFPYIMRCYQISQFYHINNDK